MRLGLWSALTLMGCTSSVFVASLDAGPVDGQSSDAQSSDAPTDVQVFDARRDSGIALDDAGDDRDALADASAGPRPMDRVRHGEFDPQNVYLAGTVAVGPCGREVMTDYESPDVAVAGFDCAFNQRAAGISTSGVLTYFNTAEGRLREFTCDDCPGWNPTDPYPSNPLANDVILPTPLCEDRTLDFALSPDGRRMHRCPSSGGWMDPGGAQVLENETVVTYGWSGFVLTNDVVIDTATGERRPTGLPAGCDVLTTRSGPETGFRVAVQCEESAELWFVDHAGVAIREGVYPAPPPAYRTSYEAALAGDGTLVQIAREIGESEDTIIERTIEGRSEVMYTEASEPAVKIHGSSLVTGP